MMVVGTMTGLSLRAAHLSLMMPTTHHVLLPIVEKSYLPSLAHLKRSPGRQHRQQQQYQDLHDSHESGHRTNGISRYRILTKSLPPVKPIVMLAAESRARVCTLPGFARQRPICQINRRTWAIGQKPTDIVPIISAFNRCSVTVKCCWRRSIPLYR